MKRILTKLFVLLAFSCAISKEVHAMYRYRGGYRYPRYGRIYSRPVYRPYRRAWYGGAPEYIGPFGYYGYGYNPYYNYRPYGPAGAFGAAVGSIIDAATY